MPGVEEAAASAISFDGDERRTARGAQARIGEEAVAGRVGRDDVNVFDADQGVAGVAGVGAASDRESASADASGANVAAVRQPTMQREEGVQVAFPAGAQAHEQSRAVVTMAMQRCHTRAMQQEGRSSGRGNDAYS